MGATLKAQSPDIGGESAARERLLRLPLEQVTHVGEGDCGRHPVRQFIAHVFECSLVKDGFALFAEMCGHGYASLGGGGLKANFHAAVILAALPASIIQPLANLSGIALKKKPRQVRQRFRLGDIMEDGLDMHKESKEREADLRN